MSAAFRRRPYPPVNPRRLRRQTDCRLFSECGAGKATKRSLIPSPQGWRAGVRGRNPVCRDVRQEALEDSGMREKEGSLSRPLAGQPHGPIRM